MMVTEQVVYACIIEERIVYHHMLHYLIPRFLKTEREEALGFHCFIYRILPYPHTGCDDPQDQDTTRFTQQYAVILAPIHYQLLLTYSQ